MTVELDFILKGIENLDYFRMTETQLPKAWYACFVGGLAEVKTFEAELQAITGPLILNQIMPRRMSANESLNTYSISFWITDRQASTIKLIYG